MVTMERNFSDPQLIENDIAGGLQLVINDHPPNAPEAERDLQAPEADFEQSAPQATFNESDAMLLHWKSPRRAFCDSAFLFGFQRKHGEC